jgi:hypothetical protein
MLSLINKLRKLGYSGNYDFDLFSTTRTVIMIYDDRTFKFKNICGCTKTKSVNDLLKIVNEIKIKPILTIGNER